ncbi:hypothetical protein [Dongia sp. agr-C8]
MTRSTQALARSAGAAFDFDVVTDGPAKPKPVPHPEPARETPPPESQALLREGADA